MSETLEVPVAEQQVAPEAVTFNPFKKDAWSETPSSQNAPAKAVDPVIVPVAAPVEEAAPAAVSEEIFDENVYVKTKYGWENPEAGLQELNELREAKKKGIEFKNDESKRAYEYLLEGNEDGLYDILDKKRKVNKLLSAENIDENIAPELIKFGMKLKHTSLSDQEIDFLYKNKYSIPPKPVNDTVNETDEEYAAKLQDWESKAQSVKMQMTIDAKLSKPDLEKFKTELVLPNIERKNQRNDEPSPELLEQAQKARDKFLSKLNSDYVNFKGYETKVKDESVELPVSFVVPDEEKSVLRSKIEGIEDIVAYFNQRWFDAEQNLNAEKIMYDLYLLENPGKVLQGLANNAASQVKLQRLKEASNITITPSTSSESVNTTLTPEQKREQEIAWLWKQK